MCSRWSRNVCEGQRKNKREGCERHQLSRMFWFLRGGEEERRKGRKAEGKGGGEEEMLVSFHSWAWVRTLIYWPASRGDAILMCTWWWIQRGKLPRVSVNYRTGSERQDGLEVSWITMEWAPSKGVAKGQRYLESSSSLVAKPCTYGTHNLEESTSANPYEGLSG